MKTPMTKRIVAGKNVNPPHAISYPTARPLKHEADFREIVGMIQTAKVRAFQTVNTVLTDLHWNVGAYISRKLESAQWGDGVVAQLAAYIASRHADIKGFTRSDLFRMRQFHALYRTEEKVAPLARQLAWSQNLIIMSKSKNKDREVVEYALSRTLSPALVAEYETKLPDRGLLLAKLRELLQIAETAEPYQTQTRKTRTAP